MTTTTREPVVWIVDADHWTRACLGAELIERGYDVVGFETVRERAHLAGRCPARDRPHVVIVDLAGQRLQRRQPIEGLARAGAALIGIAGGVDVAPVPGATACRTSPGRSCCTGP